MIQIVPDQADSNIEEVSEFLDSNKIGTGILVSVYNKKCTIFRRYITKSFGSEATLSEVVEFVGLMGNPEDIHSRRICQSHTRRTQLKEMLTMQTKGGCKSYWFADAMEFAKEILKNGWR